MKNDEIKNYYEIKNNLKKKMKMNKSAFNGFSRQNKELK